MNEGQREEAIYKIICRRNPDYCLAIRGGKVVFALINPCDRYQQWIKDDKPGISGTTIKDSEGEPAFALVNRATAQAIAHCPISKPLRLARYNVSTPDASVLWTMSKNAWQGYGHIRRADRIDVLFTACAHIIHDGHIVDLYIPRSEDPEISFHWKIMKVLPSTCISLFRPSQHTVKIYCQAKMGYNLSIDNDGYTVLLVPANPTDKFQAQSAMHLFKHLCNESADHKITEVSSPNLNHWIKETANGMPVKDAEGKEAFALVNKATGKAIKHGFGRGHLVAPFNRNYMDASLLWTESDSISSGFRRIRMQNDIALAFEIFDGGEIDCPLLGLWGISNGPNPNQQWKIEDFERNSSK